MPTKLLLFTACTLLLLTSAAAQTTPKTIPLDNPALFTPVHAVVSMEPYLGKPAVRVVDTIRGVSSEVKYVKLKNTRFRDGVIDVELAGKPSGNAVESARGFVGIAFRIADDDSKFECIYLRPTNGRADDQLRRNHSVQYISYPGLPWEKSRKETPGKYETYVDLAPGEWIKVRIDVQGDKAKLYVHGAAQPTLIINDLKHGANQEGAIGLWIGSGTDAHFTNLSVTQQPAR